MPAPTNRVQLVIPASVEYVLLARLTVAGLATRLGLPYDEVEDLRVMATEACRLLIGEEGRTGEIAITCEAANGALVIEAEATVEPPPGAPDEDDLALHLLAALADEHEIDIGGGNSRVRVVKTVAD